MIRLWFSPVIPDIIQANLSLTGNFFNIFMPIQLTAFDISVK